MVKTNNKNNQSRQEESSTQLYKQLPNNEEAERIIIGALLLDKKLIYDIAEAITPKEFYNSRYRKIIMAIMDIYEKPTFTIDDIDPVIISEELKKKKHLDIIGGMSFMMNTVHGMPHFSSVKNYCQIVREKYLARTLLKRSQAIINKVLSESDDIINIVSEAESAVLKIQDSIKTEQNYEDIQDILSRNTITINERRKNGKPLAGSTTGFLDMNSYTGGYKNLYYVLASESSMGKTSFMLRSLFLRQVENNDKVTVIFSIETDKETVVSRMVAQEAKVDFKLFEEGKLSDKDWQKINIAQAKFDKLKIVVDDSEFCTPQYIRSTLRRVEKQYNCPIGMVGIDYLGLMNPSDPKLKKEYEVLNNVSWETWRLKKQFKCSVMALHQLNRYDNSATKPPTKHNLLGSGKIGNDADCIFFLWRNKKDVRIENNTFYNKKITVTDFIVEKQKHGATGVFKLGFIGSPMCYVDYLKT